MTVSSSTDRATFLGNGVAQIFPLPFRFFANSEIQAWLVTNSTGALTVLSLGTHYTLSGAGDPEVDGNPTSELTMLTAPTALQSLFVQRVIPATQPTDIVNQGRFFPEIHENVFDRLTMLMQQVGGEAEGAIRVAVGDPEPSRLVPAAQRANFLMAFDSQGNPIAVAPANGSASDLAMNLANTSDPAKGAGQIGRGGQVVSSIAGLRALFKTSASKNAFVAGYYAAGDGGGGAYYLDAADTTSADNGGTVIVAADGARWKLKHQGEVTLKQFGAKGDGTTDDSAAWAAANTAAKLFAGAVRVTAGSYRIVTPGTLSGRVRLVGNEDATLIGNISYDEAAFPVSADTTTPLTESAPFFSVSGINFRSPNDLYALTVKAQHGNKFIDTMQMVGCRFFGSRGLRAINLITVSMSNCWFYNDLIGLRTEGCVNWSITRCYWRNQAVTGAQITENADNPSRKGGENIRFSQCEFDVCAVGVHLLRHMWGSFDSCLFDYCGLPLRIHGSPYTKVAKCYLGAANTGNIKTIPGYVAPPSVGIAMLVRPYVNGTVIETAGVTAENCEFLNYVADSVQPLVSVDGYVDTSTSGRYVERCSFSDNKFIMSVAHGATYLLNLAYCTNVRLDDNMFISPNRSSTLAAPFDINNVTSYASTGTDTTLLYQADVEVKSAYELERFSVIRAAKDTMYMQSRDGLNRLGITSDGLVAFQNATVTSSAAAGVNGAPPSQVSGYLSVVINGTSLKLPYYN